MKSTYTAVAGGMALALALNGAAMAGDMTGDTHTMQQQQSAVPSFDQLDSDSNGYLTREEVEGQSMLIEQWDSADTNSDNQLDTAEFSAFEVKSAPESQAPGGSMMQDEPQSTPQQSDPGAPMGGTGSGQY